eukprot:230530-Rhodomonas_salina.1
MLATVEAGCFFSIRSLEDHKDAGLGGKKKGEAERARAPVAAPVQPVAEPGSYLNRSATENRPMVTTLFHDGSVTESCGRHDSELLGPVT